MKNIQKIITFFVFAFMVFGVTNQALAGWNENKQGSDCSPAVGVQVITGIGVTGCSGYKTSTTAQLGDVLNVRLYYRNTSDTDATNTVVSISHVKNNPTNFSFTGSLTSSVGNISPQTVSVSIPSGTTLNFQGGKVFKRTGPGTGLTLQQTVTSVSALTNTSIGTIDSYKDCLNSFGGGDAFCFQGTYIGVYKVVQDNTNPPTYQCNDGIDNDSDGKTDYPADPGCSSATDNNEYNTATTYQCNDGIDNDSDGKTDYPADPGCSSATDNNEYNVVTNPICTIDTFTANPTTVNYGGSTTLNWNTTNCTTVTINNSSYGIDGSLPFGPLYTNETYVLRASNMYNSAPSQTRYVTVNSTTTYQCNDGFDNADSEDTLADAADPGCHSDGNASNASSYNPTDNDESNATLTCTIDTFYATPTNVDSGRTTRVYWSTTNCDYVRINGSDVSLDGNTSYGPLYNDRQYQIEAWRNGQSHIYETEYVTVDEDDNNNDDDCEIDQFYANPTNVASGSSTRLYWRTTDCDYVTIDGDNYSVDGDRSFGPLYNSTSYRIQAWNSGQSKRNDSAYVTVNNTNTYVQNYACNDGFDNDSDGRVDMNDAGCLSTTDNDEYNYVAPINTTVTTLSPTSLTSSSARINGSVFNGGDNSTNLFFEWGTDANNLANRTTSQSTLSSSSVAYYEILRNLTTGVTYYYRAVGQKTDGTILRGDIRQFTLSNIIVSTPIIRNTVITRTVTEPVLEPDRGVIVGMGTNLVQLRYLTTDTFNTNTVNTGGFGITTNNQNGTLNQNINNGVQNVCVNDTVKFVVEYRNISTITLNNAILHIDIPKDVEFRSSSSGVFNKADNTLTINVGVLTPGQAGTISFDGVVQSSAANRDLLVVPATLSFENPNNGARETAVAYGLATTQNCVRNTGGLAGLAFGGGFFPSTLFGWLLLALVLLALIFLIRRWFMVYPITRYSSNKRTTQSTHSPRYEDMDIPTAPYTH